MEFCHVSVKGSDIVPIVGMHLFPDEEQRAVRRAQEEDENVGEHIYVMRFIIGSSTTQGDLGYFKFREWHVLGATSLTQEELRARLALGQRWFLVEDCTSAFEQGSCGCTIHTTWAHSPLYRPSFNGWCVHCQQDLHYYRSLKPLEMTVALCVPHWEDATA